MMSRQPGSSCMISWFFEVTSLKGTRVIAALLSKCSGAKSLLPPRCGREKIFWKVLFCTSFYLFRHLLQIPVYPET